MKEVKVGIIGFGTVGAGVAENILKNSEVVAKRTGVKLVLTRIADLDITTDRGVAVPRELLTTDAAVAIRESDIVVELVGGTTIAKKFILEAISAGNSEKSNFRKDGINGTLKLSIISTVESAESTAVAVI